MDTFENALLNKLKDDSRRSIESISEEMKASPSKVDDCIHHLREKDVFRLLSFVDPSMLGYPLQVHFLINTMDPERLKEVFADNPRVNIFSMVNGDSDVLIECFFPDHSEMDGFEEMLKSLDIIGYEKMIVDDEIMREEFRL